METLINESFQQITVADEGMVRFGTGNVRPRIQGAEGSLRSAAYDSMAADRAVVTFDIRPYALLDRFKTELVVRRFALSGASDNPSFVAAYPDWRMDISGELFLNRGMFTVPLGFDGVFKVWMELTNYTGTSQTLVGRTMLFGRTFPEYVEAEFEGQSPYHAK